MNWYDTKTWHFALGISYGVVLERFGADGNWVPFTIMATFGLLLLVLTAVCEGWDER